MKSFVRYGRVATVSAILASFVVALAANTPGAGAAARAGHRGGTLTIAIATNPPTLNYNVTDDISITTVERLYSNYLFNLNGTNVLVPALATSYKESSNGLTYTIDLRHGVKWSDGVGFTSKDVVFTLDKFLPVNATVPSALAKDVTSVKAVGTYQVIVQLKTPYAPFMIGLTGATFFIEPAHLYGNQTVVKDSTANDHPIGTGPFIVKQWVPNQKIVLDRNPHYWGATKKNPLPYFSQVIVDIVTNPQTIVDDLLNGTVDYVSTSFLPFTSIGEVKTSSCCRAVLVHGTPAYDIMYTNTARPPFNNVTVRRAVYTAITKKSIVADALAGFGKLPVAPIPPQYKLLYTPKINLTKQYPYNPSKAAKMLNKAGFPVKNGERFGKSITLLYSTGTGTFASETAAIVKADLAKITIKVNLVAEDLTTWATATYVKKNFTLSFIGLTSENDPAFGIQRAFVCQPTPTSEFTNASGFCTQQVDTLFHQAVLASSTAARKRIYAHVETILDSKLPSYELGWRTTYVGISKKIKNYKVSLQWGGAFNTTWSESWF